MTDKVNTAEQILDSAQQWVQTRGYHAFSYADIAEDVGIRKASIHYYFPSKTDLGQALVSRYREAICAQTRQIDFVTPEADEKLQRYAQIFRDMLRGGARGGSGRICLCGVLAAEWISLPPPVREEVRGFFAENAAWLTRVLDEGRRAGRVRFGGQASVQAQAFLAGLEGAMVSARVHEDVTLYCALAHQLLAQLGLETLDINSLDRLDEGRPRGAGETATEFAAV